jgi:hypothetical protein
VIFKALKSIYHISADSIHRYICNRKLYYILAGACIYISCGFLIRIQESKFSKRDIRSDAFIEYIPMKRFRGYEPLTTELNLFKGTEALVIPTVWNAFPSGDAELLKNRPLELFDYFPEHIYLNETITLNNIPFSKTDNEAIDEIVSNKLSAYIRDYGREYKIPKVANNKLKGVRLQCKSFLGEVLLEKVITLNEEKEQLLFEPVTFLILNYVGGSIREPLILRSSGQEGVDKRLTDIIRKVDWLTVLPTGYYIVQACQ